MSERIKRGETRYTIGQMAELAGVSARTLRHYEEVGLLSPARAANGYRTYGSRDVRRLGHILAMRACGLPLGDIGRLLADSEAETRRALASHLRNLRAQASQLEEAMARTGRAVRLEEPQRTSWLDLLAPFQEGSPEQTRRSGRHVVLGSS